MAGSTGPGGARHDDGAAGAPDVIRPVVLTGCRDADEFYRRGRVLRILIGVLAWLLCLIVLALITRHMVVSYVGAALISAASTTARFRRQRKILRRRFAEQTLQLSPAGLVRTDDCARTELAWSSISRIAAHDSAIPLAGVTPRGKAVAGVLNAARADVSLAIIGAGRVTPSPGAPRAVLHAMDRAMGSRLARGRQFVGDVLIFPAEYEPDWVSGVVGAWVRHYRPDLLR